MVELESAFTAPWRRAWQRRKDNVRPLPRDPGLMASPRRYMARLTLAAGTAWTRWRRCGCCSNLHALKSVCKLLDRYQALSRQTWPYPR